MKKSFFYAIHLVVFSGVLSAMGLSFFMIRHGEVSMVEKRKLASVPSFSMKALLDGSYTRGLDLYVADHFPMRENMVEFSFWIREHRGFKGTEVEYYQSKRIAKNKKMVNDTVKEVEEEEVYDEEEAEERKGIIIYKKRAFELFGGSNTRASKYAAAINKYYNELKGEVNVYNVIVPTPSAFYLPLKYKDKQGLEKKNIEIINSHLSDGIKKVDAYNAIKKHKKEYVFFRTDHHWTGLGAYYAYEAFCESANIEAVPLKQMKKKYLPEYYGSLYYLTRSDVLKQNYDTVDYYIPNVKTTAFRCTKQNQQKELKGGVYSEMAGGYCVFLGGDFPIMRIETDVDNSRRALVVKNSFGNPFATYLVSHYKEVYVVDYRYFNLDLLKIIREKKINDLIFLNGIFSANTPYHIKRIEKIMGHGSSDQKETPSAADTIVTKSIKRRVM